MATLDSTLFFFSPKSKPKLFPSKVSQIYAARVIFQFIKLSTESHSAQVKGTECGVRMPDSKSWLCYFLDGTLGKALNLSVTVSSPEKMEIIVYPHKIFIRIKWVNIFKCLIT